MSSSIVKSSFPYLFSLFYRFLNNFYLQVLSKVLILRFILFLLLNYLVIPFHQPYCIAYTVFIIYHYVDILTCYFLIENFHHLTISPTPLNFFISHILLPSLLSFFPSKTHDHTTLYFVRYRTVREKTYTRTKNTRPASWRKMTQPGEFCW